SVTNAILHPWLKEQLAEVLAEIEQAHPRETLPPEAERPLCARWETWLGYAPRSSDPPCASCWCWIISLGICRMTWCAGSLIMG
ncbi:MAG: hypothetical protein ACXWPS_22745, partial [Ktedonobacteraceae bacterium]